MDQAPVTSTIFSYLDLGIFVCTVFHFQGLWIMPIRFSLDKTNVLVLFFSMLRLEHDVDQVSLTEKSDASSSPSPTTARSAPVTPTHKHGQNVDVGYRDGTQRGFFEGLLGCLRPVWTIIGKAAAAELKQQGETYMTVKFTVCFIVFWCPSPSPLLFLFFNDPCLRGVKDDWQ